MQIFAETDRLILRELLPTDEKGMFELDTDPLVHQYLGNKPLKTMDEVRAVIQLIRLQYQDNGIARWAVIEKETGDFAGWAGFKKINELTNGQINYLDVGYRLIRKYWGKGYATEVTKASLNYAFTTLHEQEIFAMVFFKNLASKRVLQKSGLTHRDKFYRDGMLLDWYSITRDEWEQLP